LSPAARRDLVVVGASAGGVLVLRSVLAGLEPGLGASMLITIHRPPHAPSALSRVLAHRSALRVIEPRQGERLERGVIYLAPTDRHMRIDGKRIVLDRGPKQHHTRPAIDPLFVSASRSHGERTIGVLLSGNLSDGVAGLIAIKAQGGVVLVQDPREAEWPSMPRHALLFDHVDIVFRTEALPGLLRRLVCGATVQEAVHDVAPPLEFRG
jgi:two-component system chemotaxis response regulator CheB